jgi:hypothetical protein
MPMRLLHELNPACSEAAPILKLLNHASRILAELSAVPTTTAQTAAIIRAVKILPQRTSVCVRDRDRFYSRHPCTARLHSPHPAMRGAGTLSGISGTGCLRDPG